MSDNPYSSPFDAPSNTLSKGLPPAEMEIARPLHDVAGWLNLLGILSIIGGVIYCLTIIGLVIGWLPIWIGVLLTGAASSLRAGFAQNDAGAVRTAIEKLATVARIFGVIAIIQLSMLAIYFGFIIVMIIISVVSASL